MYFLKHVFAIENVSYVPKEDGTFAKRFYEDAVFLASGDIPNKPPIFSSNGYADKFEKALYALFRNCTVDIKDSI